MATLLRVTDARGVEVTGSITVEIRGSRADGSQQRLRAEHIGPGAYQLPFDPSWTRVAVSLEHADYQPHDLLFEIDGGRLAWGDPATDLLDHPPDRVLEVPLGRVRYAPGEVPPYGQPSGAERGVFVEQVQGRAPGYAGIGFMLGRTPVLRTLQDITPYGAAMPSCVLGQHNDDGWQRFSVADHGSIVPGDHGGFAWLEYGSPDARPNQPRFLVASFIPDPRQTVKDGKVDALVFFSPSTDNDLYHKSTYPFRDKYPYGAYGRQVVDPVTKEKHDAKVQPYVLLGVKYLFHPSHLVAMTLAAKRPLLVVMPIVPRVTGSSAATQMWQPFSSQAGLWRLLLELRLFLQREGYSGPSYNPRRLNGAVAPTAGRPLPPAPAFASTKRPQLGLGDVVISAYSSGSRALYKVLRSRNLSASASDFPPDLFGADPAGLDGHWRELWALDLFLNPAQTGIPRTDYQNTLRGWLASGNRRLRMYHSNWTLDVDPDAFLPVFRKLLTKTPRRIHDTALPSRWAADWRDPLGQWLGIFFSGASLRAKYADAVVPSFPLGTPDGGLGDPPAAIHAFAMALGFGHAAQLRGA